MEWKSEAERPIFKHRLLLCWALHLHPGIGAPCPTENTKDVGRRQPGFCYKNAPLRKWKALPDHSVHDREKINACFENTKGWIGPYHLTGGESLILLLRMESRMEIGCEGLWKLRQLPMIYMIKVCQETLPLGFVQNCLCSILRRTALCVCGKKKKQQTGLRS